MSDEEMRIEDDYRRQRELAEEGFERRAAPTKERGGLTHEGFLGMWRAYLGLKVERDALRLHLIRDYLDQGYAEHEAKDIVNGIVRAARERPE